MIIQPMKANFSPEFGLEIAPKAIAAVLLERVINFSPLFSMDYSSSRSTFVF
jgi:hypothetical protein